jgi:hypothetical protein
VRLPSSARLRRGAGWCRRQALTWLRLPLRILSSQQGHRDCSAHHRLSYKTAQKDLISYIKVLDGALSSAHVLGHILARCFQGTHGNHNTWARALLVSTLGGTTGAGACGGGQLSILHRPQLWRDIVVVAISALEARTVHAGIRFCELVILHLVVRVAVVVLAVAQEVVVVIIIVIIIIIIVLIVLLLPVLLLVEAREAPEDEMMMAAPLLLLLVLIIIIVIILVPVALGAELQLEVEAPAVRDQLRRLPATRQAPAHTPHIRRHE